MRMSDDAHRVIALGISGRLSRREVVVRLGALGLSASAIGGALAGLGMGTARAAAPPTLAASATADWANSGSGSATSLGATWDGRALSPVAAIKRPTSSSVSTMVPM